MQESETEVVWTFEETRPRKTPEMAPLGRRKRGIPKQRWMDCVNRDMRAIGTTSDEVHDRTGWRRIVSAAATPYNQVGAARRNRRGQMHIKQPSIKTGDEQS